MGVQAGVAHSIMEHMYCLYTAMEVSLLFPNVVFVKDLRAFILGKVLFSMLNMCCLNIRGAIGNSKDFRCVRMRQGDVIYLT